MDIKRVLLVSTFSLAAMLAGYFLLKPPAQKQAIQQVKAQAPAVVQQTPAQPKLVKASPPVQEQIQYVDVIEPQVQTVRARSYEHDEHEREDYGEKGEGHGEHDD